MRQRLRCGRVGTRCSGINHPKRQLFVDTFPIPVPARKHKSSAKKAHPNHAKRQRSNKVTPPKDPTKKKTPLTPQARRERQRTRHKEKQERAKSLRICRHCGEPAIPGQTRCEHCAERHRISCKTYDRRRRAPTEQHNEGLLGEPTAPDAPSNAISQTAKRTNEPPPKPVTGTTKPRTGGSTTGSETSAPSAKSFTAAMPKNSGRGPRNLVYAGIAATRPFKPDPLREMRGAPSAVLQARRCRQKTAGKQTTT